MFQSFSARGFWGVELCGLGHVPVLRVVSPVQHTQWEWVIRQHDTAISHQYIVSFVKWINRHLRLFDLVSFMSLMWRSVFQSNFLLANMKSRLDWWMGAKWAITVNIYFCHNNEVFVVSPTETLSVRRFKYSPAESPSIMKVILCVWALWRTVMLRGLIDKQRCLRCLQVKMLTCQRISKLSAISSHFILRTTSQKSRGKIDAFNSKFLSHVTELCFFWSQDSVINQQAVEQI